MSLSTLVLQITNKCPMQCPQCYMERGHIDVSQKNAAHFVVEARTQGAKLVQLTGGEPMCHAHIVDIVHFISQQNMHSAISTSGYLFDENRAEQLHKAGLSMLTVSLNGADNATNSLSRAGFDLAIQALKTAAKAHLPTMLNFVVRHDNLHQLPQLVALAQQHNAQGICALQAMPNVHGQMQSQLEAQDLRTLQDFMQRYENFLHVQNCFLSLHGYTSCPNVGTTYFVDVHGNYSHCSQQHTRTFPTLQALQNSLTFCHNTKS